MHDSTSAPTGAAIPAWLRVSSDAPPADATVVGGRACRTRSGLFAEWAGALGLPEHFGHNWDALADSLHDRLPDDGLTIVVAHGEQLLADEAPGQLRALLAVLAHVGRGDPARLRFVLRTAPGREPEVRERLAAAAAH
ncbi:Barstar (barnase inhibitor) [Micromonospora pattaloongensis]|uniref:Barstar (Barnase inhibitor) n=1 Tax=Micromonospora pattaloongensis TaxID=405436 RepID=A0A1H3QAM2_9ACTN|nr:barstar family protein [Micromonospora pattaloongensis]SDZ10128.1 Barstar (barnase inhibitor) [Micromonospora pattaloongensis]